MAFRGANTLAFEFIARDGASKTFSNLANRAGRFSSKMAQFAKRAAAAGAVVSGAFAVKAATGFLAFDEAMNQSLAIMGEVSGPMRAKMEAAARSVGRTTRISATEAADAFFFLAGAGLTAEQTLVSMPVVARFAQAGMFNLSQATELLTDAQSALGLSSRDTQEHLANLTRVTDVLSKANIMSNATVEQLATSLTRKAGGALRNLNKDIEEGVAVLAAFADQGIKGRRAGTILRATLDGLSREGRENAEVFKKFNVEIFDSQGRMNSMADITADLERALKGMSIEEREATLAKMGFNLRAREGMLALLGNSKELRRYEKELRKAGGATEEIAKNQLKSFQGRLDLLKGKVNDVAISVGEVLVKALFALGENLAPIAENVMDVFDNHIIPAISSGWDKAKEILFGKSVTIAQTTSGMAIGLLTVQTKEGILSQAKSVADEFLGSIKEFLVGKSVNVGPQIQGGSIAPRTGGSTEGIVDKIKTALETANWEPVGVALGEGIGSAISKIATMGGKVATAIVQLMSSIDWVGLAIKVGGFVIPFAIGLVTGIINSITDPAMWAQLGPHLFDILIAAIGVALLPAKIIAAISRFLARIPIVGRFLSWLFESFASLSKKIFGPVLGFLGKLFGTFIQGLTGGMAGKVIIAFINWLRLFPTRIGVAALNVAEAVTSFFGKMGATILSFAGRVGGWVLQVIKWITGPFRAAFRGIGGFIAGVWTRLWGITRSVWGAIFGFLKGVFTRVWGFVSNIWGAIAGFFRNIWSQIRAAFGGGLSGILNLMRRSVDWMNRKVHDVFRIIAAFFRNIWNRIGKIFGSALGFLRTLIGKAWAWIRGRTAAVFSTIWVFLRNIWSRIWGWIRDTIGRIRNGIRRAWNFIVDNTRNAWNNLWGAVRHWGGRVLTWISKLPGRIWNHVKGLPNRIWNLGKDMIQGLKDGIINKMRNIGSWIKREIVDPVINKVKDFFGISSPSKVFKGFGEELVTGMITGLITQGKNIAKVIGDIFGGMPKALASIVGKGIIAVAQLPGKALDALKGLGDKAKALLGDVWSGIAGFFGFGGNVQGNASGGVFASGRVLPGGSYRVGRGASSHGYNARDLPAPTGTPVFAPFDGFVRGRSMRGSYGNHVRLSGPGGARFLAAHLSRFGNLGRVARGQIIGYVGSTGNSTGPHLHIEPDNPGWYGTGGIPRAGEWAWVGEKGPELMRMPGSGARIFNNRQSEDIVQHSDHRGHGEGIHIENVNVNAVGGQLSWNKIQKDLKYRGLV